jgi:dephospho-CoA kinase
MSIVALTGGIGSGKSEVAKLFATLGVPIIDTDVIAHQITGVNQPAMNEIKAIFGADFINIEGALDRAKMRAHVFENPNARLALEKILHPKIHAEVLHQIQINKNSMPNDIAYQMIVVPLLFESNQYKNIAHIKCVVDCDPELQISRTISRSQIREETVIAIMKAQVSREARLSLADEVIENNKNINDLTDKVHKMHEKLTKICLKLKNVQNN